ncbi:hypothetical protein, partial [Pseudomonas fluorescens]|uniref:hypothetical protein n=1 Tax=Pseudomonas fluorescens TaxID=294 RepID=UPI001CA62021
LHGIPWPVPLAMGGATSEVVYRRMKPPGKTTLTRMQRSAMLEAERIEITQDAWVTEGRIKQPEPEFIARRDDFAGMVRLIDAIESDEALKDRVTKRMAERAKIADAVSVAPVNADGDVEIPEASD